MRRPPRRPADSGQVILAAILLTTSWGLAPSRGAQPVTQPSPQPPDVAHVLLRAIDREDLALAADPKDAAAWQRRGVAHFRLGHVEQAVADFDRYLDLEPEARPQHWQRGIALYYAGRYEDAAKQFELHRTVNPEDVENAAWHFLCVARSGAGRGLAADEAVGQARAGLIPIRADARVPMMQIHGLFAGTATPQHVLDAAVAGRPGAAELNVRLFYAHLYLGLYYEALGQSDRAREHIALAAGEHAVDGYMGDVARVHAARLRGPETRRAAGR